MNTSVRSSIVRVGIPSAAVHANEFIKTKKINQDLSKCIGEW